MRLVLNKDQPLHTIYGKTIRGGDEFEVPDTEGQTWILLGRAMKAEDKPVRRGRYNRSDMRVEDE